MESKSEWLEQPAILTALSFFIENLKTSGKPDLTLAIAEVKQILIFCR